MQRAHKKSFYFLSMLFAVSGSAYFALSGVETGKYIAKKEIYETQIQAQASLDTIVAQPSIEKPKLASGVPAFYALGVGALAGTAFYAREAMNGDDENTIMH